MVVRSMTTSRIIQFREPGAGQADKYDQNNCRHPPYKSGEDLFIPFLKRECLRLTLQDAGRQNVDDNYKITVADRGTVVRKWVDATNIELLGAVNTLMRIWGDQPLSKVPTTDPSVNTVNPPDTPPDKPADWGEWEWIHKLLANPFAVILAPLAIATGMAMIGFGMYKGLQ